MKALLLAITAALAVVAGVHFFSEETAAPTRLLTTQVDQVANAWAMWKRQFGRTYGTNSDEAYRYSVFQKNYEYVSSTNARQSSYTVGLNKFADMTNEEFKAQYRNLKPKTGVRNVKLLNEYNTPSSADWRSSAVTGVKDQGQCGSCWAFSTTGSLEGANAIANGSLKSFSEQQLVDCSKNGNMGCNGGLMDYAFEYVQQNGIELESAYTYTARDGSCKYDRSQVAFTNSGYTDVGQSDSQLAAAVAQQPVSVAIDANPIQFYTSGVFDDWSCGTQLDHGVLAVGFESGYWIVKNSWGANWGESGYFRLARRSSGTGMCGITLSASYPSA